MVKNFSFVALILATSICNAQLSPAITSWLQNNTIFGSYYTAASGSTPIPMTVLANCQEVSYSSSWVYVKTRGIPIYPTGVFTGDGNRNLAGDQNAIYRFPLVPAKNTGTLVSTSPGNNGVFINGVSIFDYQDGVKYLSTAVNGICGGPGNPQCPGGMSYVSPWNRDAIPAERKGFDCAKGHPAGTNYHHHQNPSAFKHDGKTSISWSDICSTYNSDALYTIDTSKHSPLLGYAYDGFPIYGAYAYKNLDGTGGIVRILSSYSLKNHTTRTNGPNVGQTIGTQTFFNGYFREDYEYIASTDPERLDLSNGRFCVTPEYPNGTYAYFTTVNADHSSAYPYIIGPTFYGTRTASKVTGINEAVTVYTAGTTGVSNLDLNNFEINIFPNPSEEFIAVQINGLNKENLKIEMFNFEGKLIQTASLNAGATLSYLDIRTVYAGSYLVKISGAKTSSNHKIVISK
ncbi:MAG: YHYH protein [Saprospiraceae bacterium]|nr:YHYH protein [Saprospiraceae bacterium]